MTAFTDALDKYRAAVEARLGAKLRGGDTFHRHAQLLEARDAVTAAKDAEVSEALATWRVELADGSIFSGKGSVRIERGTLRSISSGANVIFAAATPRGSGEHCSNCGVETTPTVCGACFGHAANEHCAECPEHPQFDEEATARDVEHDQQALTN